MSPWYVMRVRPSLELRAEKEIRSLKIEAMSPYREVWHRIRGGRPRKRRHAIFPGYVFVSLDDVSARWQAIQDSLNRDDCRVALRLLPTSDNPTTLRPEDVEYLASVADGKYQPEQDVKSLRVGDQVLVPTGPLKGFVGTILRIRRGKKATVSINQIKLVSSLEIPIANLEKM